MRVLRHLWPDLLPVLKMGEKLKNFVEQLDGFGLPAVQDVRINFRGDRYRTMAEALRDYFQFHACFKQHSRVSMAERVERAQAESIFAVHAEIPHVVGNEHGAVGPAADEIVCVVVRAVFEAAGGLARLLCL